MEIFNHTKHGYIEFPSLLKYTGKYSPTPSPCGAERGDKAQLYRGEVIAVPQRLSKRYN